jgi:hypothetical protein
MKPTISRGVLYVVSGHRRYLEEAEFSAHTLKKFHPDLPIAFASPSKKFKSRCVDAFVQLETLDNPMKYKPFGLLNSPFTETLFLDSDTQVRGSLDELFSFFDHADLAAAHDLLADWSSFPYKFISYCDPDHFNTGVLLVRRTEGTTKLMTKWCELLRAQDTQVMRPGFFCDQHWFNILVNESKTIERLGLKMATFDNRLYNVRPQMVEPMRAENILDSAKIFHFRGREKRPLLRRFLSFLKRRLMLR